MTSPTTPDPIDAGRERKAFEEWFADLAKSRAEIGMFRRDDDGEYAWETVEYAWRGWCASHQGIVNSHALMLAALVEADRYIIQMGIHGKWGRDCLAQIRAAIDTGRGR